MRPFAFICPECRAPLLTLERALACDNGHTFPRHNGMYELLPRSVSALTAEEARYHAEQKETWAEQNQLHAVRNLHFHQSFVRAVAARCGAASRILEIGGGVGFDLKLFLEANPEFEAYVFSEISEELLMFAASEIRSSRVTFCTLDAQRVPFAEHQFDCVFMVAALHHFPDVTEPLNEMVRVLRPGGLIGFGLEPNRWWLKLLRNVRWLIRRIFPYKEHSAADEEAIGLDFGDYQSLAERHHLKLVWSEPVWLICGFVHYGLEFVYRVLRLRKRVRLPVVFERSLMRIDKSLLSIPGFRRLCWHNSVLYQKIEN
jgi:SAM-dependent methyltransferase